MTEDIHKWIDGRYTLMFDEHTFFVRDNEKEKEMTSLEVTKKLNEQQSIIDKQNEFLDEINTIFEKYGVETGYNKRILEVALKELRGEDKNE